MFIRKCVVLFLLSMMVSVFSISAQSSQSDLGKAPDFTLKSYSGKNIKLSEYRGQVVLMNFWASWCGPCRQEMPLLNDLHKKYKKLGFTVLGVNVEEDSSKAKGIVQEVKLTFPILFDDKKSD